MDSIKNNINPLLTLKEVAQILKVSRPQALKLVHRGDIPGTRAFGDWRVPRAELERVIQKAVNLTNGKK